MCAPCCVQGFFFVFLCLAFTNALILCGVFEIFLQSISLYCSVSDKLENKLLEKIAHFSEMSVTIIHLKMFVT